MQDAFLLIDDDQCRVCLELHAACSPGLLTVSHLSITHCERQGGVFFGLSDKS
jgi:hypothetical protein